MAFQHKANTGSLFKNDKRETDSHPNAKGSALIGGVEYFISAWTNTKDNGERWQNLKFSRKDANRAPNPNSPAAPDEFDGDNNIPW